jgi:hypothetical protein
VFPRAVAALSLLLCVAAQDAGAAEGRLYPSGPPNGVAYLRFANLSAQAVKIASPAAELDLPPADEHRVGEFDPVTPGAELTGSVQLGGKRTPIRLTLVPNEFVTVAVTGSDADNLQIALLRETPNDFNAQKAALALYNLDKGCGEARLLAGGDHVAVITGVTPGKSGRRLVNPVDVALGLACGEGGTVVPASLGPMAAGERYSIFVFAGPGGGAQTLGLRDRMAPFRP